MSKTPFIDKLLAIQEQEATNSLLEHNVLLYGQPGIGKTTFVKELGDALGKEVLFLKTEDGARHLAHKGIEIKSFEDFKTVTNIFAAAEKEAKKNNTEFPYPIICIDTVDNLFNMCREAVLQEKKIEHESEMQYGLAWRLVKDKWVFAINTLLKMSSSIWFISHTDVLTIKHEGSKEGYDRIIPSMQTEGKKHYLHLEGALSIIMYACVGKLKVGKRTVNTRVLKTSNSDAYVSKLRLPEDHKLPNVLEFRAASFVEAFNG